MTSRSESAKLMIMDACVLIDFIKADRSILELFVRHVGPISVISPIVDEVNQIDDESELLELGLKIIEPEIEDAYYASVQESCVSFQDQLCLLTAKRHGFACVTNDKSLRRLCKQEGIPTRWGLQLLAELHEAGGISANAAEMIAHVIRQTNPKHITDRIVTHFRELIREQEKRRS